MPRDEVQVLVAKVADGNQHPTPLRELVFEDLGDPRCGGGHQDDVVRRGGCVTLAAVSPDHLDPPVAQAGEPSPRQLRQPEVPFHGVDLRPEARQDRRLISAARAYLEGLLTP